MDTAVTFGATSAAAGLGVPSVIICPQEEMLLSKNQKFDDAILAAYEQIPRLIRSQRTSDSNASCHSD